MIIDIQRRLHEAGRIRIGELATTSRGGSRPAKLDRFRLTSSDKRALDHIGGMYGGIVREWVNAPAGQQWELYAETAEMGVFLLPQALSFSQFFELWSGGGCLRRCDGATKINDDGPCECDPEARECKPHTRLSLLLADLPGSGLWRLETKGFNAMEELSGAVELATLIAGATGKAILPARLLLEQREKKVPGEPTRHFAVPVLDLDVDLGAMVRGSSAPAIQAATGAAPGLAAAPSGHVTPVPAHPRQRLSDELKAIEEAPAPKPRRSNAAEPILSTGKRPRTAAQSEQQSPSEPEVVLSPPTGTTMVPSGDAKAELIQLFQAQGIEKSEALACAKRAWGDRGRDDISRADLDALLGDFRTTEAGTV